jgi:hypothetical protein
MLLPFAASAEPEKKVAVGVVVTSDAARCPQTEIVLNGLTS